MVPLEPDPAPPAGAPNVVLVVLDDVGFAHLGCYGSTIETPHIDALAAAGRRYRNFHTTAMCSPTRAALLTGRQHHAVGMGMIPDWCTGHPGYQGEVSHRAATLAEMLGGAGYHCMAVGKWHLARLRDWTSAGPFDQWPLGRGFHRFYGFLAALMDHWHPELFQDNHAIATPSRPGYHLTEDLVDQAIAMVRDHQAVAPGRPFFTYLALGACHSPHHAPREFIDRYAGRFDEGWDRVREQWFERQLALGVVPPGTRLTPRNPAVRDWDSLSADEQRLCARHQEVFAGFLTHADAQIGRLVEALRGDGLLDDTLFIVLSDNGATEEGGDLGDVNIRRHYQFLEESVAEKLAALDRLGSEHCFSNYPRGWGHVGNTPHQWFKMHTHGGGVRDPLIVHWPARVTAPGAISPQFCHCVDIVPTVLECVGVEAPAVFRGVEQLPLHGHSLAPTFAEPDAPPPRRVQYFELLGHRGLWADGWKAVTHHVRGTDFDRDRWELYHVDQDFSESTDLADRHPEKLAELVALWWEEARAHQVLPLDDRDRERILETYRVPARTRYVYRPGTGRVSVQATPPVAGRTWQLAAEVVVGPGAEGVILSAGSRFGGYVLFMQGGRAVFELAGSAGANVLESAAPLSPGLHQVVFRCVAQGPTSGLVTLSCDGHLLDQGRWDDLWPLGATAGGLHCGRDDGCPVSDRYACPFPFTGRIDQVTIDIEPGPGPDPALAAMVALQED